MLSARRQDRQQIVGYLTNMIKNSVSRNVPLRKKGVQYQPKTKISFSREHKPRPIRSGEPFASLSLPFRFPFASLSLPFRFPFASLWLSFGFPLAFLWLSKETSQTPLRHHCVTIASPLQKTAFSLSTCLSS